MDRGLRAHGRRSRRQVRDCDSHPHHPDMPAFASLSDTLCCVKKRILPIIHHRTIQRRFLVFHNKRLRSTLPKPSSSSMASFVTFSPSINPRIGFARPFLNPSFRRLASFVTFSPESTPELASLGASSQSLIPAVGFVRHVFTRHQSRELASLGDSSQSLIPAVGFVRHVFTRHQPRNWLRSAHLLQSLIPAVGFVQRFFFTWRFPPRSDLKIVTHVAEGFVRRGLTGFPSVDWLRSANFSSAFIRAIGFVRRISRLRSSGRLASFGAFLVCVHPGDWLRSAAFLVCVHPGDWLRSSDFSSAFIRAIGFVRAVFLVRVHPAIGFARRFCRRPRPSPTGAFRARQSLPTAHPRRPAVRH